MQVPGLFEYQRASDVEDAIALLDRLGDEARVVAGGHSLLPMMKLRLANPEYLVDINDLAGELGRITVDAEAVHIGALARHRQILDSDDLAAIAPIFRDAERVIADPVVRNRGTIGGSLCQADPAEDLTTVCSVVDAICVIRGPTGVREVATDDFLTGPYETVVESNEILVEVRVPRRPPEQPGSSAYTKVERRVGDWAIAAAGASLWLDGDRIGGVKVGLTAVGPDPERLRDVGEFLRGQPVTEEVFRRAGDLAAQACTPLGDGRGTVDYKRHLAGELTVRSLRTAAERAHLPRTGDL